MEIARYLTGKITSDAIEQRKIAFLTGPRQVGKSTIAKALLENKSNYYLYDEEIFRRTWSKDPLSAIENREAGPIVLDEIHKDRLWKRKLKGIYDQIGSELPIVVAGSARLGYYRRGSDSLLGRYLPYRIHPFSVAESVSPPEPELSQTNSKVSYSWEALLNLSGFPEPFLNGNANNAKRWSRLRTERLVYEDSRDFRNISDVNAFQTLIALLPERVGSLLSVNSLREDVGKAYGTVRNWLKVLDILYYSFTIKPFAKRITRAIRAEPKLYLFDILAIPESEISKRRENLAALHLLKAINYWEDLGYGEFELRFSRDKSKRELDFLILKNHSPWIAIECKSNQKHPSSHLLFFAGKLKPDYCFQLVNDNSYDRYFAADKVRILGYEKFFSMFV